MNRKTLAVCVLAGAGLAVVLITESGSDGDMSSAAPSIVRAPATGSPLAPMLTPGPPEAGDASVKSQATGGPGYVGFTMVNKKVYLVAAKDGPAAMQVSTMVSSGEQPAFRCESTTADRVAAAPFVGVALDTSKGSAALPVISADGVAPEKKLACALTNAAGG
ncbi:hypothetical protein [Amycolatopsis pithecellobii]|uniref:Uncharacterized protein n=1 Tax=Amycolatopsis pithecellobii TaxID=664692 RepID=A0A6N7Z3Q6_9PSEU|nr:hypothetical protein [Amycolatopsis pithecellobii]MTD55809.1 hypothetical protein [Amycolatopsis pithecellobii]